MFTILTNHNNFCFKLKFRPNNKFINIEGCKSTLFSIMNIDINAMANSVGVFNNLATDGDFENEQST